MTWAEVLDRHLERRAAARAFLSARQAVLGPGQADTFRNLLALFLITAFVLVLPLFVFKNIPTENKELIVYMVGQLSGMATTALAFYFTQKAGDAANEAKRAEVDSERARVTGKMAEAVVAAATAGAVGDGIGRAADSVAEAAADRRDEIKGEG